MKNGQQLHSGQRAVTSLEVGRAAGVSQAAVSRVFTPGASVSKAMRDKVTAAAERLGYHPNALARGLAGGRSYLIAIVVFDLGRSFFGQIVEQLIFSLQTNALKALVVTVPKEQDPRTTLREIMAYGVDGVVVATVTLPSSATLADGALREGLPVVLINQDSSDPLASAVCCDDRKGADMAATLLVSAGCRSMMYLSGTPDTYTSQKRLLGFREAVLERCLPEPLVVHGDYTYNGGLAAAEEILASAKRPDGVFCANDLMALGLIDGLRNSKIKVGEDLSVVGFDGIEAGGWAGYELTTVEQPLIEMSRLVTALLTYRITNRLLPGEKVLVAPQKLSRGSCRSLGSGSLAAIPVTR